MKMQTIITARLADIRKKDIEALSPSIIVNNLDKPKRFTAISCQDAEDFDKVVAQFNKWGGLLFEVEYY